MELILLERIQNLGQLGDQVSVKSGYGRNYLVPQGKAILATKDNKAVFEAKRTELEKKAAQDLSNAEARHTAMQGLVLEITANASSEGKLYGSVGPRELATKLIEQGYPVEKSEILLAESIRQIGEHEFHVRLHADLLAAIKVNVLEAEESA